MTGRTLVRQQVGMFVRRVTLSAVRYLVRPEWESVHAELDAWKAEGRRARFWIRDDDAVKATEALDRLLRIVDERHIPIALSVVPASVEPSLAARVRGLGQVAVLQHGWDHANRADPSQPACELTASRDVGEVTLQLGKGRQTLIELFDHQFMPVLVPPHNRVAIPLLPVVAELFSFVSAYGDFTGVPVPSRNAHVDLIDWTTLGPAPTERIVPQLLHALQLRRLGIVAASSPIGILTHHLAMSSAHWQLFEAVLTNLGAHDAALFANPREVFS